MILALKFASQRGVVLHNTVVNQDEFDGAIAMRMRIDVAGQVVRGLARVTYAWRTKHRRAALEGEPGATSGIAAL